MERIMEKRACKLVLESLESRLLLNVDLYLETATVYGLTGQVNVGDPCSINVQGIGNHGDEYVYMFKADAEWALVPVNNSSICYDIWKGYTSYPIPANSSGGSLIEYATIPQVPPGDYQIIFYLNPDHYPTESNYTNNYVLFNHTVTILPDDDYGNTQNTASMMELNHVISGQINYWNTSVKDTDYFKFHLNAGAYVSLVISPGTLTKPHVTFYDSDGSNYTVNITEPYHLSNYSDESADYYISVSAGNGKTALLNNLWVLYWGSAPDPAFSLPPLGERGGSGRMIYWKSLRL